MCVGVDVGVTLRDVGVTGSLVGASCELELVGRQPAQAQGGHHTELTPGNVLHRNLFFC